VVVGGVDLNDLAISKEEVSLLIDNTIVVSGPVIETAFIKN